MRARWMQRCAAGNKHSRGRAAFTDMQRSVNGPDVRAFITTSSVKVLGTSLGLEP